MVWQCTFYLRSPTFTLPPVFVLINSYRCACRGSVIAKIIGNNVRGKPDAFVEEVLMYVYEEIVDGVKLTEIINTTHENTKYLPGCMLPDNVVSSMFVLSFIPGLKPPFSANPAHHSLSRLPLLQDLLHGFPRLFTNTSERIHFLLFSFFFSCFQLLVPCSRLSWHVSFGARVKIASHIISLWSAKTWLTSLCVLFLYVVQC